MNTNGLIFLSSLPGFRMDPQFDSSFKDLDIQASHAFRDFMTRYFMISEDTFPAY